MNFHKQKFFLNFSISLCMLALFDAEAEVTSKNSEVLLRIPPQNSWEAWMLAMMKGGKGGLPGRPDGKKINEELPVWVDCFLSHYIDQPQTKKNALLSKLVLKAHSKLCIGSLSEWAE